MKSLIFATANRHKLEEIQSIMPDTIMLSTPADHGITEDIPENESTLEGNASAKAWYIYKKCGVDCFADDTGLEVEVLGGEPGVRSARYAETEAGKSHNSEDNMSLLLYNMNGQENRTARFRTIISLILNGVEYQFEGIVHGVIRNKKCGTDGFGYDPIFEPNGYNITFAQMSIEAKNLISHRGIATAKLVEFLSKI